MAILSVTSQLLLAGGKSIKADSNGIYHEVPLAVIGKPSYNRIYEPNSVIEAMFNPSSFFYKKLKAGQMEGEWVHPMELDPRKEVIRNTKIDRFNRSHLVLDLRLEDPTPEGYRLLVGKIKPVAPCGKYLIESFEDPYQNTAFSYRTLIEATGKRQNDRPVFKVTHAITIDAEGFPGYAEASKLFVAREAASMFDNIFEPNPQDMLDYDIELDNRQVLSEFCETFGNEAANDPKLQEYLSDKGIIVKNRVVHYNAKAQCIVDQDGNKHSMFHDLYNKR